MARWVAPLLLVSLLGGCASLIGPRQVEVPVERLQQGLDRRFPVEQRLLSLFDVRLSRPRLALMPETDRIGLTLDAALGSPLLKQPLHGELSLSGHLALNAAGTAVMITGAKLEQIEIGGLDGETRRQIANLASAMSEKIFLDAELYPLRAEQLRYAGVQFVPTDMVVTSSGLVMKLVPAH